MLLRRDPGIKKRKLGDWWYDKDGCICIVGETGLTIFLPTIQTRR